MLLLGHSAYMITKQNILCVGVKNRVGSWNCHLLEFILHLGRMWDYSLSCGTTPCIPQYLPDPPFIVSTISCMGQSTPIRLVLAYSQISPVPCPLSLSPLLLFPSSPLISFPLPPLVLTPYLFPYLLPTLLCFSQCPPPFSSHEGRGDGLF